MNRNFVLANLQSRFYSVNQTIRRIDECLRQLYQSERLADPTFQPVVNALLAYKGTILPLAHIEQQEHEHFTAYWERFCQLSKVKESQIFKVLDQGFEAINTFNKKWIRGPNADRSFYKHEWANEPWVQPMRTFEEHWLEAEGLALAPAVEGTCWVAFAAGLGYEIWTDNGVDLLVKFKKMVDPSGERLIEESTMNATAFGLTTSIASAQLLALPAWELPDGMERR